MNKRAFSRECQSPLNMDGGRRLLLLTGTIRATREVLVPNEDSALRSAAEIMEALRLARLEEVPLKLSDHKRHNKLSFPRMYEMLPWVWLICSKHWEQVRYRHRHARVIHSSIEQTTCDVEPNASEPRLCLKSEPSNKNR